MKDRRILIAGCGDIGSALALQLSHAGWRVSGLRRQADRLPDGIEKLAADMTDIESLQRGLRAPFDSVVITTTAGRFDAETYRRIYVDGLRNLLQSLAGSPRILLASSTSVYHQHDGEWVDEDSLTEPTRFPGQIQLEAERLLRAHSGVRAAIVRFGGIYGPGRERLLADVRAGIGCPCDPPLYTNRIHRDDCVGMLDFLLRRQAADDNVAPLYLGVDCEPATQWDVRHWLADRLGVTLDDNATSSSARSVGSKRCSNRRLLAAGYTFRYPSFREGYAALMA
jgi:nucleoside-diphosphate-sugar epimerase